MISRFLFLFLFLFFLLALKHYLFFSSSVSVISPQIYIPTLFASSSYITFLGIVIASLRVILTVMNGHM